MRILNWWKRGRRWWMNTQTGDHLVIGLERRRYAGRIAPVYTVKVISYRGASIHVIAALFNLEKAEEIAVKWMRMHPTPTLKPTHTHTILDEIKSV